MLIFPKRLLCSPLFTLYYKPSDGASEATAFSLLTPTVTVCRAATAPQVRADRRVSCGRTICGRRWPCNKKAITLSINLYEQLKKQTRLVLPLDGVKTTGSSQNSELRDRIFFFFLFFFFNPSKRRGRAGRPSALCLSANSPQRADQTPSHRLV